jgi:hypothetical protein
MNAGEMSCGRCHVRWQMDGYPTLVDLSLSIFTRIVADYSSASYELVLHCVLHRKSALNRVASRNAANHSTKARDVPRHGLIFLLILCGMPLPVGKSLYSITK